MAAPERQQEAVYVYEYADGTPAFEVVKYRNPDGSKDFRQRRPGGQWGLGDTPRLLYHLPEVNAHLAENRADALWIAEGEKDADALRGYGVTATCNPMGAGKWLPEHGETLQGVRLVRIVVDRDEEEKRGTDGLTPGERHARQIVESLARVGVANVELVQAAYGKDAYDHLEAGYGLEDFVPFELPAVVVNLPVRLAAGTSSRHLTDLGNAERYVEQHRDHVRYCYPWSTWLTWDSQRWARDTIGEAERRAVDTVRSIQHEGLRVEDPAQQRAIVKHGLASEQAARVRALLELARSEEGIPVRPEWLDSDPMLLNLQNGTLDLRTLTLREHRRGDHITKLAPIEYDADAEAPRWGRFLEEIFDGSATMIEFVQRAVGYSLTGETSEQCFFLLHGNGQNGKSTFLEMIAEMLGDYAQQAAAETFLETKYDAIPNDVARLHGARFVTAVESSETRRLNEAKVKQMTGGDRILARFLRAEFFEFTPLFKIWLATNHRPQVRGTDQAMWRRVRLLPFHVTIPEEKRDKQIKDRLRGEFAGILNWAIEGLQRFQYEGGLGREPDEAREALAAYRLEQDVIGRFLEDCCRLDQTGRVRASELYTAYCQWAEQNGERRDTLTRFGRELTSRGFDIVKGHDAKWRLGLELVQPATLEDDAHGDWRDG